MKWSGQLAVVFAVLLGGCSAPTTTTWLEGFGYEWAAFNHRLSYLNAGVDDAEVYGAVVGGTSTTGGLTVLPDGCDFSVCHEIPVEDRGLMEVNWARVTTRTGVIGVGSGEVLAGAQGGERVFSVPLERKAKGLPAVVLRGLTIDTHYELMGGEACYDPLNGWHPRRLSLSVEEPVLAADGQSVDILLKGIFEAGNSLEEIRQCLDEVNEEAQVAIRADVLVVVTPEGASSEVLSHSMTYDYGSKTNPALQPDPDMEERGFSAPSDEAIIGWSGLDFQFHDLDPESRGAYIRSLAVQVDPEVKTASGHATNYSPGTQITGFDYVFTGTLQSIHVGDAVERGHMTMEKVPVLDEEGNPTIYRESLP